jgi:hypothetical protein
MTTTQKILLALFLTLLTITGAVWVPLTYRWIETYFEFTHEYMFAPFMVLMITGLGLLAATIMSWVNVFDKK